MNSPSSSIAGSLAAAQKGDEQAFRALVAPHQRELRAYCYRMAGSLDVADDLLQESLLRAWKGIAAFEGRSSLRTWLYRVTWSACVDALEKTKPRHLTIDQGPPADPSDPIGPPVEGHIGPCPPSIYEDDAPSPEARYTSRESVAFAFLAALQLLPPKQRAALIARDVLGWSAEECADMLETSVASVNSALQRARDTLDARASQWRPKPLGDESAKSLLARYVDAWSRADVGALVTILREDATLAMPPLPIWLLGAKNIGASIGAMVFLPEAKGAFRLVAAEVNGMPGFAAYQRGADGKYSPMAIHALALDEKGVASITAFLDPRLFAAFGFPAEI